jgi:Flp pilus assembly protein TadG
MRVNLFSAKGASFGCVKDVAHQPKNRLTVRLFAQLGRFRRDEDGSMIIFTLFLILMMLIIGGMAVDLMRFETNRSRLQATLDRAVLAAADLDQHLSPEQVVRDYFQKAGLLDQLASVSVVETINSRSVSARAAINVNMMFMDMLGIEQLEAPAAGMARETVTDIEIALVLDVSGSMRSNSKIQNLRIAASNFVQTVLAGDVNNKVSISIVPFNAQVNLGAPLRGQYNVTDLNGITNSNCIDLPTTVFATPAMSRTLAMPQSGYFDALTSTTQNASYIAVQAPNFPVAPTYNDSAPTCKVLPNNIVRLPSNNITTLQSNINGLTADGNTSITLGVKWALALLDPGSQPIYANLISSGNISSNYAGRPYAYNRQNTLKVIVVMTDGEHVASTRLNAAYRSGATTIYKHTDGMYSIRHTSGFPAGYPFYVPHLSAWQWRPWNGTAAGTGTAPPACANNDDTAADPDGKGICVRVAVGVAPPLTWPQVWSQLRMSWVAQQLYARPLSNNNATNRVNIYNSLMDPTLATAFFQNSITAAQMDTQLQTSCQQARTNGVVVFGIAFEAPALGQQQIFNCASSPSHYYVANGSEINTAFYSIANQIQSLRLMQ